MTHVVPHLCSIPQDVLARKLAAVQAARSRFFFRSELTHPPNAVNTMASGICQRHKWGLDPSQLAVSKSRRKACCSLPCCLLSPSSRHGWPH